MEKVILMGFEDFHTKETTAAADITKVTATVSQSHRTGKPY
jgi:hypothetical protein